MTTTSGVFSIADVIVALDDVAAGVACFGVPLQDGHTIVEVAPGCVAGTDGWSQLERPVAEMLAGQARAIRSYARFILSPARDTEPITDPAARADAFRAAAAGVLERGPMLRGHDVATPAQRAAHRDALARIGVRFKAELLRRQDPDAVDAWCADVADEIHVQAAELREIEAKLERLHGRVAVLDARRKAAHAPADLAYVRRCIEQNMVTSWGRVGEIAVRWGVPCPAGTSGGRWLHRLVAVLEPVVAGDEVVT